MLLTTRTWESHKDALPAQGVALLDALGFPWNGQQKIRVAESCLEAGATLYVFGTLDQRRNLPDTVRPSALERVTDSIRTGEWRRSVAAAVSGQFKTVLAVFIGCLDMFTRGGVAKTRPWPTHAAIPPAMEADTRLVWTGRDGHPFLVSDRPEDDALLALPQRVLAWGGFGAVILCFTLYTLVGVFTGK